MELFLICECGSKEDDVRVWYAGEPAQCYECRSIYKRKRKSRSRNRPCKDCCCRVPLIQRPDTDNPLLHDSCWQSRNSTNTSLICADCNREYTLSGCDTPHYGSRNSCGECRPDHAHRCQRCRFPLVLERPRAVLWQSLIDINVVEDSIVPTLCGMCKNYVTSADMSGYKPAC